MSHHLMLVPSLACPASCKYCFGPHTGKENMSPEIVHAVVDWQNRVDDSHSVEITFHGGEPIVPGLEFYRVALPILQEGFSRRRVHFGMQSNLWLLTPELCTLFQHYNLSIGTSLDGPEALNDAQRGSGYYQRTMAGIKLARRFGLDVGCIATFTRQTLPHTEEVFNFFVHEGLNFSIHAAISSLRYPSSDNGGGWSLTPEQHGDLLVQMLDLYLGNLSWVRISTLDSLCRSISAGEGGICTFGDCLGGYLAVGPDGSIYPCQRFAGINEFVLANVLDRPSATDLQHSPVWQAFQERQEHIAVECSDCVYFAYCRGGCPYQALVAGGSMQPHFNSSLKDPHCEGYKKIFFHISDLAIREVFSEENLADVVQRTDDQKGLLRRGRIITLMREGPHPYVSAQHARRILAAAALAMFPPEQAALKLQAVVAIQNSQRSLPGIKALYARLTSRTTGLNNLYLHVTLACNLHCTHCYASAGERGSSFTTPEQLFQTVREAAKAGFRHVVITGGEPLIHPRREVLLDVLTGLRAEIKPMLTVLRTNLAVPMDDVLLEAVACSTDQVVVSLDGDRETHDARRGCGSYDQTIASLRELIALKAHLGERFTDLSLATVLPLEQANGTPGESVRALAREMGIRRIRFRPLLPLGRAMNFHLEIVPETLWGHLGAEEMVAYGFFPTASCGIGQNMYIEPDGEAYPCYAWHSQPWLLGNIFAEEKLAGVLSSSRFQDLGTHTVNTNLHCQNCELRYLCGGACRAWNLLSEQGQIDLDAAPRNCASLRQRARSLLVSAMQYLNISSETWEKSGLPLPVIL